MLPVSAPYPFSAVVGLDDLRLALVVNAVSPVGRRRARARREGHREVDGRPRARRAAPAGRRACEGCRFSCSPAAPDPSCPDLAAHGAPAERPARLVELPVGASEDRLVGSLDLERALTSGVTAYEPGLLAAAHRGVLYVDEVNLLHDHLVDLLLDAAALGTSYVEREGVSVRHAARFLLVGTMNPEEGELRPQLLDRFGLTVEVAATRDPAERADVVRRRLAYEADPEGFAAAYAAADAELAGQIAAARARLPRVVLGDRALREVTTVCAAFDVDGLRADLVTAKAAVALAAWAGRDEVTTEDVRTAARLALPHRRRRTPFEAPGLDEQRLDDALDQVEDEPEDDPRPPSGPPPAAAARAGRRRPGRRATRSRAPGDGEAEAEPRAVTPGRVRGAAAGRRAGRGLHPGPAARARRQPARRRRRPALAQHRRPAAGSPARGCPRAGSPSLHLAATLSRRRPAPAAPAAAAGRAWCCAAATCARRSARAARATSCCSSSTPPARWPPARGWARSRARC